MEFYKFLTDEEVQEIDSMIPNINNWLDYQVISIFVYDALNDSKMNSAFSCLDDARNRFSFARTAFFEAKAKMKWYLEISSENESLENNKAAIACGKFFFDYVTLLLYAIAEDIASFIVFYYNIDIERFKNLPEIKELLNDKCISSKSSIVGHYLKENMKGEAITSIVSTLVNNPDWKKVQNYRNTWVHEKPPTITELGVELSRDMYKIEEDNVVIKKMKLESVSNKNKWSIYQLQQATIEAVQAVSIALNDIVNMINQDFSIS